jgi:exodeoxyribonuclease VII small subunit
MATRKKDDAKDDAKSAPKFEEAMAELEDVVRKLEAGDVPLEESLSAFEKGVGLVRVLHKRLDSVQEKIEELTRDERGEVATRPLDEE